MESKIKAIVPILVSDKMDFQPTKETKKGIYVMIKGRTHQEELKILNTYTPNTGAPRYIKQVLKDL